MSLYRLTSILGCFASPLIFAAPIVVTDDFDASDLGTIFSPANNSWSTKWIEESDQQNLLTIIANGQDGHSAALDTTLARRNFSSVHQNGITGDLVILESDLQLSITGTPLNDTATGGTSGVNQAFASVFISDTPNWWNGNKKTLSIARRQDGIVGVALSQAPWITGWIGNANFGLEETGTVSSQSDWFRLRIILTDDGAGNFEMDQELYGSNSQLLWTLSETLNEGAPIGKAATGIPVSSTIYGGFTTPWINDETDPTILAKSKVDQLAFDNFSLSGFSASIDADGDNLTEAQEGLLGTDDTKKDTDGDNFDDDVEVAAGSNPLSDISDPVIDVVASTDFSDLTNGPLNDVADWTAQSSWNIRDGVLTGVANWNRAIINNGIALEPGETAGLRIRFRVLGDADFSLTNHGILSAGFSPKNGSGSASAQAGATVASNSWNNGIVKFNALDYNPATLTNDFLSTNAGSWPEAYDVAGYDSLEEVAANMRTTGPSDWMELTILATKMTADSGTPNGFEVRRILTDLEGDNQKSYEINTTIGGLEELWGDADGDNRIYPVFANSNLISKSVDDGAGGTIEHNMTDGIEVSEISVARIVEGDYDEDNLSNVEELLLDTNAALKDTDGDGVNDDVEIANGTDPLVNNNPGGTNRPTITAHVVNGNDLHLFFTGFPETNFKLTESAILQGPFTEVGLTTTTDDEGEASFTYPITGTKNFLRVEKD